MRKPITLLKNCNTSEELKDTFANEIGALKEQRLIDIEESANTDRINAVLMKVREVFKVNDTFSVIAFKDKGKTIEIGVENEDYVCTFLMKDTEKHGLVN